MDLSFMKFGVSQFFKGLINKATEKTKSDILESWIVLSVLALNTYKPNNTKFSIYKNKISLQEPGYLGLEQGIKRSTSGDKDTDISILVSPLTFATNKYLKSDRETREKFRKLFEKAIDGLERLKQTYADRPIIYTYTDIIRHMNDALRQEKIIETKLSADLQEEFFTIEKDATDPKNITKNESENMNVKDHIYVELNKEWNESDITVLLYLFDQVDSTSTESAKNDAVDCLEKFIKHMENRMIKKIGLEFGI